MKGKAPVILGVIFVLIILAVLIYTTIGLSVAKVEVCMEFNGRTNCGTASGQTKEFALRTATANACALISGGVGDTIACEQKAPASVKWIK
jgi:hypothetical protein